MSELDSCKKKRRYDNESAASLAAIDSLSRRDSDIDKLWKYRCMYCNGWHLTSQRIKNSQPILAQKLI